MELDPYPWVHPKSGGRYGSEYPRNDGLPMVHLGLEFKPQEGYSQDRADYPDHGWTMGEVAYARGYYIGYQQGFEDGIDLGEEE